MPTVHYIQHDGTRHEMEIPLDLSVMEGAVQNGIAGIDADCGGALACATCLVNVDPSWMEATGPADDEEQAMLEFAPALCERSRLSCQIRMKPSLEGLVVHLPASQR